jgi:hypothetical protein
LFRHVGAKFLPKSGKIDCIVRLHIGGKSNKMLSEVTFRTGNSPIRISELLQFSRIGHEAENPNGYCTGLLSPHEVSQWPDTSGLVVFSALVG